MKSTRRISLLITLGLLTAMMIVSILDEGDDATELGGGGGGGTAPNRELMLAVQASDFAGVKRAIARGAQPCAVDSAGFSPIARAVTGENVVICQELLAHGANPDGAGMNETIPPIVSAAIHDDSQILDLLIRHGADVNACTSGGSTALNVAASLGRVDIAAALIRAGADVNAADAHGWTPLMGAATRSECAGLVDALLAAGARTDATNDEGETAFRFASRLGNRPAVRLLLLRDAHNPRREQCLGMTTADASDRHDG